MSQHRWQIGCATLATAFLLLTGGCASTDFLPNGNSTVTFEVVTTGTPAGFQNQPYDCIQWGFGQLRIRPLDGTCGPDSVNAGDPCLTTIDCDPLPNESGTCEGSEAAELIGDDGIQVKSIGVPGNILAGGTCNPSIAAGGVCQGLFVGTEQLRCSDSSECTFCEDSSIPCDPDDKDFCPGTTECVVDAPKPCVNPSGIVGAPLIPPNSLVLSAGLYEISSLRVGDAMRYQNEPDPPLTPKGPFFRGCQGLFVVEDAFRDSLRFTVLPNQDKVVRFVVDLEGLEANTPGAETCTNFLANIVDILDCETCEPAP